MDTEIQPSRPSILQNTSERKPITLPRRRCRHDARVLLPRIRYIVIAIVFCGIITLGRADDEPFLTYDFKVKGFCKKYFKKNEELLENSNIIFYLLVFLFPLVFCDIVVRFSCYIHRKWTGKDPIREVVRSENDELYRRLEDLITKNGHSTF